MNERDESLIIAALVARAGGRVTITMVELADLRSRTLTTWQAPNGLSIEITIDMPHPTPIDAEFRVLEDQRR